MSFAVRSLISSIALLAVLGSALPAGAQDDSVAVSLVEKSAGDDVDSFDPNESEAAIDWVTRALVGIAAGTGLMLVFYLWHTAPRRRFMVATRRLENRELAQADDFADDFMLPVDFDDEPDPAPNDD